MGGLSAKSNNLTDLSKMWILFRMTRLGAFSNIGRLLIFG
jgi:hypothetical protein